MHSLHPYSLFHLGDAALTIEFGNEINEDLHKKVLDLYNRLQNHSSPFIFDIVPAYSSLAIHYDVMGLKKKYPEQTAFDSMADLVEEIVKNSPGNSGEQNRFFEIPVCYAEEFAPDMNELCLAGNLSRREVIDIHTSKTYRVYMLGFLPGFTYMGSVDERIRISRKQKPRLHVASGSIGIAGEQTGIYPLDSPGGWQIIGRTPVRLFARDKTQPVLFSPGDIVKFYPISQDEFKDHKSRDI